MYEYNIEIRQFNGIDYDILHPITKVENVQGLPEELDNKVNMDVFTITLNSSDWSGNGTSAPYTKTISVPNTLSTDNILINLVPSSTYATAKNQYTQFQYISYVTPLNNEIKFTCLNTKPTISLSIKVLRFK